MQFFKHLLKLDKNIFLNKNFLHNAQTFSIIHKILKFKKFPSFNVLNTWLFCLLVNTTLQIVEIRHQEQNDNLWIDQITRLTSLLEDKITNKVYEIGIVKKSIS